LDIFEGVNETVCDGCLFLDHHCSSEGCGDYTW